MKGSPRYIFDTNVLISAALFANGSPGQAFRRALIEGTVVLSPPTFEEIDQVLARDKFNEYLSRHERADFIEALLARARFAHPSIKVKVCRDPDDNKFLELAVSEQAACIISGDQDLLVLNPFRGIPIMTAASFLTWLQL